MKKRQKKQKRWLWCAGGVIVVAAIVAGGLMLWHNNNGVKGNEVSGDGSKTEETIEMREKSDGANMQTDEDDFAEQEVEKKKVVQYEADDPNAAEELSGVVSFAEVVNGVLMLRVSVDQYLTEGSCKLSLERGGEVVYSETVRMVGDVATATCEGFDVPVSRLGAGDLDVVIGLNGGGKTGTIRGEVGL